MFFDLFTNLLLLAIFVIVLSVVIFFGAWLLIVGIVFFVMTSIGLLIWNNVFGILLILIVVSFLLYCFIQYQTKNKKMTSIISNIRGLDIIAYLKTHNSAKTRLAILPLALLLLTLAFLYLTNFWTERSYYHFPSSHDVKEV